MSAAEIRLTDSIFQNSVFQNARMQCAVLRMHTATQMAMFNKQSFQTNCSNREQYWMQHNSCEVLFIAAYVLHALFMSSLPSFQMQLRLCRISTPLWVRYSVSATVLTVADGAQSVVVINMLTDDPPLGEHRVGTDGVHIEAAPGSQQVVGADVTLAASDGKVPVGQSEGGVTQHVLHRRNKGRRQAFMCPSDMSECVNINKDISPVLAFILITFFAI